MSLSINPVNTHIYQRLQPINPIQSCYHGHLITRVPTRNDEYHHCSFIPSHLTDAIYNYEVGSSKEEVELDEKSKEKEELFPEHKEKITAKYQRHCQHTHKFRSDRVLSTLYPNLKTEETEIRIYDAQHTDNLKKQSILTKSVSQTDPTDLKDVTVKNVLTHTQDVYDFYKQNFNRNSIDNHGMDLISTVHFEEGYDNAFWNGEQMVYGDGDGKYFQPFAFFVDVVGHELTHGVTGNRLNYRNESGALNESNSDIFGTMVEQFINDQTVDEASWLIGYSKEMKDNPGILIDPHTKQTYPLRSMKEPGTAFNIPGIGKDDQVGDYAHRYTGKEDEGGVHMNSGIPNKAFYLACTKIYDNAKGKTEENRVGLYSWEVMGKIWYITNQTDNLVKPNATIPEFANATIHVAKKIYKESPKVADALREAWLEVGLKRYIK